MLGGGGGGNRAKLSGSTAVLACGNLAKTVIARQQARADLGKSAEYE